MLLCCSESWIFQFFILFGDDRSEGVGPSNVDVRLGPIPSTDMVASLKVYGVLLSQPVRTVVWVRSHTKRNNMLTYHRSAKGVI